MTFIKYFFYIFFVSTLSNSCAKHEKKLIAKTIVTKNGLLPIMTPFENNLPKLSLGYIESKKKSIESFVTQNWINNSMNGSFLVAKNGQIIYEKYQGIANREKQIQIDSTTPIHIASVSKVITATAVLLLIDAKKIDLDQKLNTILPTFPYPEISIKTLLNHRSGLKNYAYFTNNKKVWDSKKILSNQDVLNVLANNQIPLEFPTDSHFSYSNTNYAMLALVIEKITDLKYDDAISKMIFNPLKMTNSYVFDFEKDKKTATPSYKWNNQKYALDYLDAVYGDKNVYSTPKDLLKFDLARHSDNFLSADLRKKIYTGYSNERKGTKNYGLGIRMIEWETGEPFYFHNGWWHGNTSSFVMLGKEHVTIIALSNKFNHATYKVRNLAPLFGDYPFKVNDSI